MKLMQLSTVMCSLELNTILSRADFRFLNSGCSSDVLLSMSCVDEERGEREG